MVYCAFWWVVNEPTPTVREAVIADMALWADVAIGRKEKRKMVGFWQRTPTVRVTAVADWRF